MNEKDHNGNRRLGAEGQAAVLGSGVAQTREVLNRDFGHPDFYLLLEQMADLHSRKNHDYAGTSDPLKNLRACTRLDLAPFMGVMVRLQDKWSRLEEFTKSGKLLVKDESVIDTLLDNAVYSLLGIILLKEQKAKQAEHNAVMQACKEAERMAGAPPLSSLTDLA